MSSSSLPSPLNTSNPYEKIRANSNGRIAKMQFPTDMGRYYIAFEFATYGPTYNSGANDLMNNPILADTVTPIIAGIANTVNNIFGSSTPSARRTFNSQYGIGSVNAAIALPIPSNLVDDQQLDYNAQNLLNVAAQMNSTVNTIEQLNSFQSIFSGQTVNPFLAMMFNGPRFKTHQFAWRFSPRTSEETDSIVKIVNTFKAKSLPVQYAGGSMFSYPDVCLISLYPTIAREKMYKFKPAVITQTSIHYAPSGTPSFFAGSNGPAEIEVKLQLSEISIWTNNDFPNYDIGGR